MFKGKTIVLGVTGGVAAYKAPSLASALSQMGADVYTAMTKSALEFVQPLSFQSVTGIAPFVSVFEERFPKKITHIHLADAADIIVVAPATANIIAKHVAGMADDMLSSILLATENRSKILFCPAMNVHMWNHPATVRNVETLRSWGISVLEPASGHLACGYDAKGKFPETKEIVEAMESVMKK